MVVVTNEPHAKMVLRIRRLIQRYNKALRDGNNECLGQVKRQLELEIVQQDGITNVVFLQSLLDKVDKRLAAWKVVKS